MFQLSMCGLFTSLISAGDLGLASVIVVSGEVLYMLVYKFFNTSELKEAFIELLHDIDFDTSSDFMSSLKLPQIKKSELKEP